MKEKTQATSVYKNGNFTGVYKGSQGDMLTASHMTYTLEGEQVTVEIDDGFIRLYTYMYDQYRSFKSQDKDYFCEWELIFKRINKTYDTKKSKNYIKLLTDCGLLKQVKSQDNRSRIKIVYDVSTVKHIKFTNKNADDYEESMPTPAIVNNESCVVNDYSDLNDSYECPF